MAIYRHCVIPCLLALAGCENRRSPAAPAPATIVISGDTSGWISPCGCASNQSGGLPRRGTYIGRLRLDSPTIYLDAGGAAGGLSEYDRLKFEFILRGELALDVGAHNLGLAEARLGAEYLRRIAAELGVPFVSCNVRDDQGQRVAQPMRWLNVADRRIAVTGVLSDAQAIDGLRIEPPREAILDALAQAESRPETLLVLAYLNEEELTKLAGDLPEADFVIGGPTRQSISPRRVGPAWLASATNKGKFVATFHSSPNGQTPQWTGEVAEMNDSFSDDAQQIQNLNEFHERLAERELTPDQTSFVSSLAGQWPEGFQIAGTESCRDCHADETHAWKQSRHSSAWQSLEATGAQVDAECQRCHTTGFGVPGGFVSAKRSVPLASVGCESCHGPSLAHVRNSAVRTAHHGRAANQCERCHDRENSPEFAYDRYWAVIRHGSGAPKSALPSSE